MSSAGTQAGVLAPVAPCHWPCRPRAWANRLSIWIRACSSWVPRRSPNGYHWVLSIIWFSLVLGPLGGRRLGDNAVRVRAAGALAEYPHPTLNTVHLSRTVFKSPWFCDLPITRTQRVGSPNLRLRSAQLSAGSRQPGVSLIEVDHRPGRRRPPRRPADPVRIAARSPLACIRPPPPAAPASPVRIHGARTRRSIRSAGLRPMRPVMACARWAAHTPKDQSNRNDSSHAQTTPSAPGAPSVALATHARRLRTHRVGAGRPSSLGRPGAPRSRTAHAGPAARRGRAVDLPGRADAHVGIDHHHAATRAEY